MPIHSVLLQLIKLAAGIHAISASYAPVSFPRAAAYAVAATYHGWQRNIDPYELVGVARNESDFIATMKGPDGKDCGLTQTRVTITHYSCKQLLSSYWLAFAEGAREMDEYRDSCRGHADFDRCRINKYNSGVRYSRSGFHGAYYLRVMCFAEAARQGVPVENACRRAETRGDIRRILVEVTRRHNERTKVATADVKPRM